MAYLCIAPLFLLLHSSSTSGASTVDPNALMKMILDMVRPLDDSSNPNTTLPPYHDSLPPPMPLPLNAPPFCLYPPSPGSPYPTSIPPPQPQSSSGAFSPTPPEYSSPSAVGGFSPTPPEYNPPSGASGFNPSPPQNYPPSGGGGGGSSGGGGSNPSPSEYNPPSGGGSSGGGGFNPSPPENYPPSGGGGGGSSGGGGSNPSPVEYNPPSGGGSSGGGGFNPSPPSGGGGTPVFLPPIVYPTPAAPPPPYTAPKQALWCVVKPSVPEPIIQEALNYACASGAECSEILEEGACFQPNTVAAHASYAFNSYWQRTKVAGSTCGFGGIAIIVSVDPSYSTCHFIYV